MRNTLCNRLLCLFCAPQFGSEIEIKTRSYTCIASCYQRFYCCLCSTFRQRGRNPTDVKPLAPFKNRCPIHHPGFDIHNRGMASVIRHGTRTRPHTHFHMIKPIAFKPYTIKIRPQNIGHIHPVLAPLVANNPTRPIINQPGHPRRLQSQMRATDRDIVFPPTDLDIEFTRIFQPAVFWRRQPNHRLAKSHDIVHIVLPKN